MPIGEAIRAGRAYIELSLHDPGLQKQLSNVQKRFNTLGRSMRRFGGVALGAGSAIAGSFALPIKAASDAQETLSKFSTVFGDIEDDAMRFSVNLASTIGRSKYEIAKNMASFQDLFVPMGLAADDAFEMSKTMTRLAEDLASFNNLETADVIRDLQAAMTGSGETMKKYGVILSEGKIKDRLKELGLDATEVNKAFARQQLILESTTAAQGDAERTAGSFANQMKALKATIDETMVTIGQHLLPMVTPLVGELRDAASSVGEFAAKNSDMIQVLMIGGGAVAAIGALGTAVGIVAAGFTTLLGMPIVASLTAILGIATALSIAFSDWADAIRETVYQYLALESTRSGANGPLDTDGASLSGRELSLWERLKRPFSGSAFNPANWLGGSSAQSSAVGADFQEAATPEELKQMRDLAKKQLAQQQRIADLLSRPDGLVFE